MTKSKTIAPPPAKTVGIDIAKAFFDVHLHPAGLHKRFANTTPGRRAFLAFIEEQGYADALFTMEASGGYERPLRQFLSQEGYAACVIQPARAWHFIKAMNVKAKTDRLDAKALALFAASGLLEPRALPEEACLALRDLSRALTEIRRRAASLKGRIEKSAHADVAKAFTSLLKATERQAARMEKTIETFLQDNPDLAHVVSLMTSVPGIGWQTAIILAAELPELGACSKEEITALAGIAPFIRQSGKWQGKASIKGGRKHARNALYMASLSAIRFNPLAKALYQRKLKAGKPKKSAIVAAMHKILVALNSMVKHDCMWQYQA
jgi:transposase